MASSSVPPSVSAASVWAVVFMPDSEEPEDAFEIKLPPDDVSELKEAVKERMKPELYYCAATALHVWHSPTKPRQRPRDEPRLEPETALVDGHYYWVEAPVKPPAPGC